jgi:hypothetical protein
MRRTGAERRANGERRGMALLFATIVVLAIGALCMAMLMVNLGNKRERVSTQRNMGSFYAAEAGISDGYMQLTEGLLDLSDVDTVQIGTPDEPVSMGASDYWVEISALGSKGFSIRSTGVDGLQRDRLELILSEVPTGFFQFAAFGKTGVVLDSNSFIDSYDSAEGSYESQVQGGNEYAKENGNVGSNGDIILKSNTTVHGDVLPGPGHVVEEASTVYVSGEKEPADEEFYLPPIEVPIVPSSGKLKTSGDVVLGPGPVHYSDFYLSGHDELTIVGPAVVVMDGFEAKSGADIVFDTTNGPIELYATGDFVLQSNSTVTTLSDSALDVTLLLSGDNMTKVPPDQLSLGSNSDFIGAIYAPNAEFSLASNFNIYGSIMCGMLDLSSFGEIHFDEALLYDGWGSTDEFEAALWRRIAID